MRNTELGGNASGNSSAGQKTLTLAEVCELLGAEVLSGDNLAVPVQPRIESLGRLVKMQPYRHGGQP